MPVLQVVAGVKRASDAESAFAQLHIDRVVVAVGELYDEFHMWDTVQPRFG